MKRGQKRSPVQRERDRHTIAQMALKGYSQLEIADYLEISQGQISKELKRIKENWRDRAVRDQALAQGRALAKLELVEREFWEAWQASRSAKETALVEQLAIATDSGDRAGNTRTKKQKRTQDQNGDPAFLRGVLDCIKEQAKVLGLYPADSDRSGSSHNPVGNGTGLSAEAASAIRAQILGVSYEYDPQSADSASLPTEMDRRQIASQGN